MCKNTVNLQRNNSRVIHHSPIQIIQICRLVGNNQRIDPIQLTWIHIAMRLLNQESSYSLKQMKNVSQESCHTFVVFCCVSILNIDHYHSLNFSQSQKCQKKTFYFFPLMTFDDSVLPNSERQKYYHKVA